MFDGVDGSLASLAMPEFLGKRPSFDAVDVRVLKALFSKGCLAPNTPFLEEKTGFSRPTILVAVNSLLSSGVVSSFMPSLYWRKMGFLVDALVLFYASQSRQKQFQALLDFQKNDVHCSVSQPLVSNDFNLAAIHAYRSVEEFHAGVVERYYRELPGLSDVIKRREIYYMTEPVFKEPFLGECSADIVLGGGLARDVLPAGKFSKSALIVLKALFSPGAVKPRFEAIKRETGLCLSRVKSRVNRLQKQRFFRQFIPLVHPPSLGIALNGFVLTRLNVADERLFERLMKQANEDVHLYGLQSLVGSDYNIAMRFLYKDINSFNKGLTNWYAEVPELLQAPKQVLYLTQPSFKYQDGSETAVNILAKELL